MAAHLSGEFNRGFNAKDLDLNDFDYDTDRELFTFHVDCVEFTYNINQNELMKGDSQKPDENEDWETFSPDSTWIAFAREHDLNVMRADNADSTEIRLTEDGERWYSYQADQGDTTSTERLRADVDWLEDSEKLYVKRQDWRDVDELWVINTLADERPELETYKYNLPGEDDHYQDEIMVFDMESREGVRMDTDKWPDQSLGGAYFSNGGIYMSDESDYLWILRRTRTWDEVDVVKANTKTGETEVLWTEKSEPYFNVMNSYLDVINNGEKVKEEKTIFSSEIPSNTELADNLQGRLLLVHGEMDNNVHPANTYRMADALVRTGKRFDMMIFPGARHGFGRYSDYFERMLWDYFAEHLLDYEIEDVDYNIPDHVE